MVITERFSFAVETAERRNSLGCGFLYKILFSFISIFAYYFGANRRKIRFFTEAGSLKNKGILRDFYGFYCPIFAEKRKNSC